MEITPDGEIILTPIEQDEILADRQLDCTLVRQLLQGEITEEIRTKVLPGHMRACRDCAKAIARLQKDKLTQQGEATRDGTT